MFTTGGTTQTGQYGTYGQQGTQVSQINESPIQQLASVSGEQQKKIF